LNALEEGARVTNETRNNTEDGSFTEPSEFGQTKSSASTRSKKRVRKRKSSASNKKVQSSTSDVAKSSTLSPAKDSAKTRQPTQPKKNLSSHTVDNKKSHLSGKQLSANGFNSQLGQNKHLASAANLSNFQTAKSTVNFDPRGKKDSKDVSDFKNRTASGRFPMSGILSYGKSGNENKSGKESAVYNSI